MRDGLPPWRVVVPALGLSAYCWFVCAATFTAPGRFGPNYNAVGTDWMVFHAAARSYYEGRLAGVFGGAQFTAFLNQSYHAWLSQPLGFRPWVYPPTYLLMLLPFGLLGFWASYGSFQLATATALVTAILLDEAPGVKRWNLFIAACAIVCPAAAVNAVSGQNAFLTAAILLAGVKFLDRRPLVAGLIFGIATIKPQFAILLPFALALAGRWKTFSAAVVSAAVLALLSALVFGWNIWNAWLHQMSASAIASGPNWTEYGRMWGDSIWTCLVLMGVPHMAATVVQVAFAVLGIAAVAFAFRHGTEAQRIAVLLVSTLLAAPHWASYDAIFLVIAGLYWMRPGQARAYASWNWVLVLALWFVPAFSPPVLVAVSRPLLPLLLTGFAFAALPSTGLRFPFVPERGRVS